MNRAQRRSNGDFGPAKKVSAPDTRYVYGAGCTWNDNIQQVGSTPLKMVNSVPISLPCCPFCGSMLFELKTEELWLEGVRLHDKFNPGYFDFCTWLKGKCFPELQIAIAVYNIESGKNFAFIKPVTDKVQ